jgi:hypothetical protein
LTGTGAEVIFLHAANFSFILRSVEKNEAAWNERDIMTPFFPSENNVLSNSAETHPALVNGVVLRHTRRHTRRTQKLEKEKIAGFHGNVVSENACSSR